MGQSACVRALLETALDTPAKQIAAFEALGLVYQKLHAVMATAREEIVRALLAEFEEH